jgi:predicted nucleotidyltransferase
MRVTGIIAEYNPFHNGHAYQAAQARHQSGADIVVAVMSGHITQRGELAIIDKWHRAQAAVNSGVDLVLELPTVFVLRSAQYFAAGGVRLLQNLGIIDYLSFGAEEAEISSLKSAAMALDDFAVAQQLKTNLRAGKTYAAAMAQALVTGGYATGDFIISPNNILGVEYLRALSKYAPQISPLPIQRIGSDYHATDLSGRFSSATAIRRTLKTDPAFAALIGDSLPGSWAETMSILFDAGWAPADASRLDAAILAKIRHMTQPQLQSVPEISEGLENRLYKAAHQTGSVAELLTRLKTKRYPITRLKRILNHLLLGTNAQEMASFEQSGPLYARVLALNDRGRMALRAISRSGFPIITKTTDHFNSRTYHSGIYTPLQSMLAYDIAATDLFALCLPNPANRKGGLDFSRSALHITLP